MTALRRTAIAAGTAALLTLPLAAGASAHVTVQGPGAAQGGFTKLTFRVPTEQETPTTRLEVVFPVDAPIASVRVKPHVGWTATMTKAPPAEPFEAFGEPVTEVVTRITWSLKPGNKGIAPGEFDEFEVSAGPLPEVDRLVFKALQTYADGTVVRWIEEPVEGGEEPEKPAPVLELAPAEGEGSAAGVNALASSGLDGGHAASSADSEDRLLTIAALVLGLLGLATGGTALLRGRRAS